jgi:hypothetical protein
MTSDQTRLKDGDGSFYSARSDLNESETQSTKSKEQGENKVINIPSYVEVTYNDFANF